MERSEIRGLLPAFRCASCGLRLTPPRRDCDVMWRIEQQSLSRLQPMGRKNLVRCEFGHAGKATFAAGQSHMRRFREPEGVIAIHEHLEYDRAADDGDHAG